MIPIATLKNKHAGRPGVVMGGGPSLGKDLAKVPKEALRIAVNHHGLKDGNADYTVFLDDVASLRISLEELHARGGILVSRHPDSDVDLGGPDWWQARFSGQLACWFACWIGCDPVLLCGMNLYRNPPPTVEEAKNLAYQAPLEEHLKDWKFAFKKCPHPERIRAVSGPLVGVFGSFPPKRLLHS
jgi:hypothetical protein